MTSVTDRQKLTPAQLREYHRNGFVSVPDVFGSDELAALDAHLDELLVHGRGLKLKKDWSHRGWIHALGEASDVTRRFAEDPRILSLIEDIVKPGIAIFSAKLATKQPHSTESDICHWHQDDAYYQKQSQSDCRCSIWVPLQDADEANGCLWVVPGSHQDDLQPHAAKDWGTCRLSMDEKDVDLSKAIPLPVKAGSMVIFSALLWHHSKHNTTDRIRRAFIVSYQEATATRGNGSQWKILRPAGTASPHRSASV